jgi:hypothetical protein
LSLSLELLLEPLIESEILADDAEPALDADDAKLSACAGALQAAANRVRHSVRERIGKVMALFHLASRTLLWYKPLRRMTIGQFYRV